MSKKFMKNKSNNNKKYKIFKINKIRLLKSAYVKKHLLTSLSNT